MSLRCSRPHGRNTSTQPPVGACHQHRALGLARFLSPHDTRASTYSCGRRHEVIQRLLRHRWSWERERHPHTAPLVELQVHARHTNRHTLWLSLASQMDCSLAGNPGRPVPIVQKAPVVYPYRQADWHLQRHWHRMRAVCLEFSAHQGNRHSWAIFQHETFVHNKRTNMNVVGLIISSI